MGFCFLFLALLLLKPITSMYLPNRGEMALYNYDTPTNSIGDENYEIVDTADDLRRPVVEVKRLSVPNYFQPRQQHLVSRKDRVSMLNPLYGFSFGKR